MGLAMFQSTNYLGALRVAFEARYDRLDPFVLYSKCVVFLLQVFVLSLKALDFADHLLLGCFGVHVVMAFILDMPLGTSLTGRLEPIALPAIQLSIPDVWKYGWRPCTFALALLQFVQAFGVTESGTLRFLPVMLPPLPDSPVCCLEADDVADSEPVFPVDVLPVDESG